MDTINKLALSIVSTYYKWTIGISLSEVIDKWQQDGQKIYDDNMPVYYSVKELWTYREYTWTRDTARDGYAKVEGRSIYFTGELKWDAIKEDMISHGWSNRDPLIFLIGRSGGAKVGEGNHRLAIAKDIGLMQVPVGFQFYTGSVKKQKIPEKDIITERSLKKTMIQTEDLSPKDQKVVDDILNMLGL